MSAHGVTMTLVPGWTKAEESLTPDLISPRELISVGTFPMRPGGCDHAPSRAYADMRSDDAIITIMERPRQGGDNQPYPARPDSFEFEPQSRECVPGDLKAAQYVFREADRNFYAFVVLGAQGPVKQALSVLNSFTADTREEPPKILGV